MPQGSHIHPIDPDTHLVDTGLYRPGHTACYLLRQGEALAWIDCGAANGVPRLLGTLDALGFTPEQVRYILPTHVHLDHGGGAGLLLQHCPNAVLATHHRGLPHLIDPEKLQRGAQAVYGKARFEALFGALLPAPKERCRALRDGDTIDLNGRKLLFLDTPGHANHHGCLFDSDHGLLFTGDTFGLHYPELDEAAGKPFLLATTTPVAFDPEAWRHSLERMMALAPRKACLTHFGPLDEPRRHLPLLLESLELHERIALAEEHLEAEGRQERLRDALKGALLETLPGVDEGRLEALLGEDLTLNAQGLTVWLARRAKRREKRL